MDVVTLISIGIVIGVALCSIPLGIATNILTNPVETWILKRSLNSMSRNKQKLSKQLAALEELNNNRNDVYLSLFYRLIIMVMLIGLSLMFQLIYPHSEPYKDYDYIAWAITIVLPFLSAALMLICSLLFFFTTMYIFRIRHYKEYKNGIECRLEELDSKILKVDRSRKL